LLLSAAAVILTPSTGLAAGTVYLNQADFTAALVSGYDFENFNSMDFTGSAYSYSFSKNGFDWTASTTDYYTGDSNTGNPPAILFIDDAGSVAMTPAGGDTGGAGDVLTLSFTSGNVTAIGGDFFLTNFLGDLQDGSFTLTLNDGTTETFNNVSSANFFGYISSSPITSLTFVPPTPYNAFATIDNLYVGEGEAAPETPETSTIGLLAGGLSLVGALGWRRRNHACSARSAAR